MRTAVALQIGVTPVTPPIEGEVWPLPDPPETAYQLQLAETDPPNSTEANHQFKTLWKRSGGDWHDRDGVLHGTNHYATAQCPAIGSDLVLAVGELVKELLIENRGIYLRSTTGGPINFASKEHTTGPGPRLSVVSDQGTFDCPCIADMGVSHGKGDNPTINNPSVLKFDLSAVVGNVQGAALSLRVVNTFTPPPGVWSANLLWMPRVYTNPRAEVGSVRYGLAKTFGEMGLVSHPSVLLYRQFPDFPSTWRDSDMWANTTNDGSKYATQAAGSDAFISQPEYGTHKLRVTCDPNGGVTIINRSYNLCPPGAGNPKAGNMPGPARPFQWEWGEGPQELYGRCLVRLDPDLDKVAISGGVKLAGFDASYDQWTAVDSNDPAVWPPAPPYPSGKRPFTQAQTHSERMEVSANTIAPRMRANPGIAKLWCYLYSAGKSRIGSGSGSNEHTETCVRIGFPFWLEQRVKLNTQAADGTWLYDGEMDIWIDGVLVLRRKDFQYRTSRFAQWQRFWMVCQHGGTTASKGAFFVEYGNICVAKSYIGPPE